MADEELVKVELNDGFYRDSMSNVIWVIIGLVITLILVVGMSIYLYIQKPPPLIFEVADEFRVQPPVPLDKPYKSESDLLQWVANVFYSSFTFDYINYSDELAAAKPYFTNDGWTVFQNQLKIYADYNNVQQNRLFINGSPNGAPFITKQGLYNGRYAWYIEMPLYIKYQGLKPPENKILPLQLRVVRVPTLNNLDGVAIDDMQVLNPTQSTGTTTAPTTSTGP